MSGRVSDCRRRSRPVNPPLGRSRLCSTAALAQLTAADDHDYSEADVDAVVARDGGGNINKALSHWLKPYRRIRDMASDGIVNSPDAYRAFWRIDQIVNALRERREAVCARSPLPEPPKVIRCRFEGRPRQPRRMWKRGHRLARGDPDPDARPPAPWFVRPGGRSRKHSGEPKHPHFSEPCAFFHRLFCRHEFLRPEGRR